MSTAHALSLSAPPSPLAARPPRSPDPATSCDESAKCISQICHSCPVTLSSRPAFATRSVAAHLVPPPDGEERHEQCPRLPVYMPLSPSRPSPPALARTAQSTWTDLAPPTTQLVAPNAITCASPSPSRVAHRPPMAPMDRCALPPVPTPIPRRTYPSPDVLAQQPPLTGARLMRAFDSTAALTTLYAVVDAALLPAELLPADDPVSPPTQSQHTAALSAHDAERMLEAHILSTSAPSSHTPTPSTSH